MDFAHKIRIQQMQILAVSVTSIPKLTSIHSDFTM